MSARASGASGGMTRARGRTGVKCEHGCPQQAPLRSAVVEQRWGRFRRQESRKGRAHRSRGYVHRAQARAEPESKPKPEPEPKPEPHWPLAPQTRAAGRTHGHDSPPPAACRGLTRRAAARSVLCRTHAITTAGLRLAPETYAPPGNARRLCAGPVWGRRSGKAVWRTRLAKRPGEATKRSRQAKPLRRRKPSGAAHVGQTGIRGWRLWHGDDVLRPGRRTRLAMRPRARAHPGSQHALTVTPYPSSKAASSGCRYQAPAG